MKELSKKERNVILAEFMNIPLIDGLYRNSYEVMSYFPALDYSRYPGELEFTWNWQWLMPVVQEIENKTEWVLVMASGYAYFVKDGVEHEIGETDGWQDIENICKIVVEFIEWYNCKNWNEPKY